MGIGFVGLIFLYWLKIIPAQQAKTTMGRQDINVPFTIQITDKTFHFENEFATTHLPWNFVKKWRKDSKVVILYMQDNMLRVIPLRLVQESERKNLIELISKNQSQFINKSSGAWTRPVIILVIIIISFLFFFFVWKH